MTNNIKSLVVENAGFFTVLNIVGGMLSSLKNDQPLDPAIITLTVIATVLNSLSSYIRGFVLGLPPELRKSLLQVMEGLVQLVKTEDTPKAGGEAEPGGEGLPES